VPADDDILGRIDYVIGETTSDTDVSDDAMRWNPEGKAADGEEWTVIHSYTRTQAIADGVLHPVPEGVLREAGIVFPMAVTAAAWADCVAWADADAEATGNYQDESGRLWDLVWMTRLAIMSNRSAGLSRVIVQLERVPRDRFLAEAEPVTLVAVCGPGDDYEPVITVMAADED
jgi:hypothetical protein